jgi:uncharacterized surface anchored protein
LSGTNDLGPIAPQFMTTDANGAYSFDLLRPGTYTVAEVSQPSGYIDGLDTRGNVVPIPGSNRTDVIPGITIGFGQTAADNNFGELKPGGVSGFVYFDKNNNGIKQPGEPGIPGVPVELTGTNDEGPIAPEFTTTDASGAYSFDNLRPGTYAVTETEQPAGYKDGLDTRGNAVPISGSNKTDVIPGITIGFGQTAPDNNFGEIKQQPPGGNTGGGCPMPPAEVESVHRIGIHHQTTQFVLTFNTALDPASAANLASYRLVVAFRDGRLARREVPLKSAVYNPANNTVTLTPVQDLNIHFHYQLTVSGLKDACGRPIDGDDNGVPGGDFVTIITKQNLVPPLPNGPGAAAKVAAWAHRFPRPAADRLNTPGGSMTM